MVLAIAPGLIGVGVRARLSKSSGRPADRSLFARSECRLAMPALQATKRRGAGIGGVVPRLEESLPRAPVPAVPLPWAPGHLCPRLNAYGTADSKQNISPTQRSLIPDDNE
jgi:hypothetical protein